MTVERDPPRLVDAAAGADEGLVEALEVARRRVPSAARMDAMERGILAKIGPPRGGGGGGGGGGGSSSPSPRSLSVVKSVLGLAALIGAGLLVARALIPSSSALPAPRVASALTEAPMPSARVSLSVSSAPSGETAPPTVPVESLPLAPASAAVTPSAPSATPAASPVTPAASAPAPTTETELAFLQRAQDSLATEPARTLALCAEHAQRFPRGVLGEEREVLAIDALTRLGHRDAAEARARRFLVTYPTSAHKRRIEQLLGGD